jgi:translation initiation factor IF-1
MPEVPALSILGVKIQGEIAPGDSVAERILDACRQMALRLEDGDVVVVTHKIVSKSEGRVVRLDRDDVNDHVDVRGDQSLDVFVERIGTGEHGPPRQHRGHFAFADDHAVADRERALLAHGDLRRPG